MRFTKDLREMLIEYRLIEDSIISIDYILKNADMSIENKNRLNIIKATRRLEREQIYLLMAHYFLWLPINSVMDDIYAV